MTRPRQWSASPVLVRRLTLASLVANVLIVITGGAVRLTGSGLGCPNWPSCTGESYTVTRAMGIHGAIEYGNRILAFLVVLIVGATLVAALLRRPRDRRLVLLAALLVGGVLGQAVVGGITVLTGLNPYVVAAHFLVSMAALAAAYFLWARAAGERAEGAAGSVRWLGVAVVVTTIAVLTIGTVVTGSGPHAGDPETPRTGFDPELVAQLHTDAVFLLIGLSVAAWLALRAIGAGRRAITAAAILVGVELAQGVIGFVQYFTALPIALVAAHMAGACAVWLAALHFFATTRGRPAT